MICTTADLRYSSRCVTCGNKYHLITLTVRNKTDNSSLMDMEIRLRLCHHPAEHFIFCFKLTPYPYTLRLYIRSEEDDHYIIRTCRMSVLVHIAVFLCASLITRTLYPEVTGSICLVP